MKSWHGTFMNAAWSAFDIGQASAVTVGHRLPMLAAMPFFPGPELLIEANRMVTEKLAAILEGTFAASGETFALATRTAFGRTDADDLANGMFSIAAAAANPAHRAIKANARRLSRRD